MDGSVVSSVTITLPGAFVDNTNGLARDPAPGTLYALLEISEDGRELVTLDPATGVATSVGNTGDKLAGLAFDNDGTLYGVTGDGAGQEGSGLDPETLYSQSLVDGTPTRVGGLGRGGGGEAIGLNSVDGLLYHMSGQPAAPGEGEEGSGAIYESVDVDLLPAFSAVDVPFSAQGAEATALVWWSAQGVFLEADQSGQLNRLATGGFTTLIEELEETSKGLASTPERPRSTRSRATTTSFASSTRATRAPCRARP